MKATAAISLARPAATTERGRLLLIAAASAAAASLVIGAIRVARIPLTGDGGYGAGTVPSFYASDSGIKPAVLIAAALMAIPVAAFAVQALRVGSVARDRRMAALRLAGAAPRDVRTVAAVEAGGAAFLGGLLAAWVYPLLWLVLGVLPPDDRRLLPRPEPLDIAVWAGAVIMVTIGGAIAGAAVQQRVISEPLGVFRRANRGKPGRVSLFLVLVGPILVVGAILYLLDYQGYSSLPAVTLLFGVVLTAIGAGPRVVRRRGRRLRARGTAEDLLAGWRLEANPHPFGRVGAVLILCGVALAIETVFVPVLWYGLDVSAISDEGSVEPGVFLALVAAGATFVAITVAVLTLIVGAADQLLDSRRSLATLSAMGVPESTLARVLERQLSAVALPAVLGGVLVPGLMVMLGSLGVVTSAAALGFTALTALLAWLVVAGAVRLATRLLTGRLRAALDPENLRVG